MSCFEKAFFKLTSYAVLPIVLICSILFAGSFSADALSNPLAGKPLTFDEILPYLSVQQTSIGDNGDNPLQIVIEPSAENEEIAAPKEKMSMEDIFG